MPTSEADHAAKAGTQSSKGCALTDPRDARRNCAAHAAAFSPDCSCSWSAVADGGDTVLITTRTRCEQCMLKTIRRMMVNLDVLMSSLISATICDGKTPRAAWRGAAHVRPRAWFLAGRLVLGRSSRLSRGTRPSRTRADPACTC